MRAIADGGIRDQPARALKQNAYLIEISAGTGGTTAAIDFDVADCHGGCLLDKELHCQTAPDATDAVRPQTGGGRNDYGT